MPPTLQIYQPHEIVAATAADEAYAAPLAVTIRSAIDSLAPGSRLRLFVLDGGFKPQTRDRLEKSWEDPRARIEWVKPDTREVKHLPVDGHVTITTYLRLLLPDLLPSDVSKLIFLDSDMLLKRDLGWLQDEPLGDSLALAVQEMAAPYIDARVGSRDFERSERYLASPCPVVNYRSLGIPGDAPYFNAGLMVFDAARWRAERVGQRVLDCLTTHREHVLWWDQYALNVTLAGRWRQLDARWNQTASIFQYPTWRESPLDRDEFYALRSDPWIVHFCTPHKPWHYLCDHPARREFFEVLDRTEWRGWRPEAPPNAAAATWKFYRRMFRKSVKAALMDACDRLVRAA